MMNTEIECPKCKWKPDGGAYWQCRCGTSWNTFDTQGICPNCKKRWKDTQCPGPGFPGGCGAWSPHVDWYKVSLNIDELFIEEKNEKELSLTS
ncbi:MAG: hypothetical protein H7Y04_09050 [Verrucomicrobia bacterium]|nr:hypothetical protein [Cytophagales bacterium]